MEIKEIRPYKVQFLSSSPCAPSMRAIAGVKMIPSSDKIRPPMAVAYTRREKYSMAFSSFCSPSVLATMALPPVPIIKPNAEIPIINGMIRLIAAKAVLPTKLDTNNPSTTLYMDVKIIIMIDGNTNRNNFLYVKCSDNEILIHNSFPSSVR